MDLVSARLRVTTIFVGLAIAGLAAAIILAVVQYFFGMSFSFSLIFLILGFVLIMDIIQWLFSPYIIGKAYRLTQVREDNMTYSWLVDSVRRISQNNGMRMPMIFIAEVNFPNAFAYSSPIAGKRIAITRPMFSLLTREELEAVLAHEVGHLRHRDIELLLAIGLIPTLMFYLAYGLLFSGRSRQQNDYGVLIAIGLLILSFVFNIMILGINRMRETYADLNAVNTADHGAEHLQSALAKIVTQTSPSYRRRKHESSNSMTGMLLFSDLNSESYGSHLDLLEKWRHARVSRFAAVFSSHPHPARRIQLLEKYR